MAASQALWTTSKHGKAIPSLIECLKDDDWGVRHAACAALGDIGQDIEETEDSEETKDAEEVHLAIAALTSALVDQQSNVRATAVLALEQFGIRTVDSPFVVAKLKELLDATGQPPQWKQSIERPNRGWDYNGQQILGHLGHDICLWDIKTGKLLQQMRGHQEQVRAVQFGPAGLYALSSSWVSPGPIMRQSKDTRTILWNLTTGQENHSLKGQVAGEFSPDGKRIVTFSQRPGEFSPFDAAVWEVDTGRLLVNAKLDDGFGDPYWGSLHFSPDGRSIVRNSPAIATVIYGMNDGREIARINTRMSVSSRYTSRGTLASFDLKKFELFDTAKLGQAIKSIEHGLQHGPKGSHDAVWTQDGSKVVAVPTGEEVIKIWDVESGKKTIGAKVGPYPKQVAFISPDNGRLAVEWGGANEVEPEFGLYDMRTGEEVTRIKLAEETHLLGFAPDSKTLLVGCPDCIRSSDDQENPAVQAEFSVYNAKDGKKRNSVILQRP